jgi:predicted metal-dependent hydrolase
VLSLLSTGIDQFNAGNFFEAHDLWEELWRDTRGEHRLFYQGLIQTAVGFYHLGAGNTRGAQSQMGKALTKLRQYPAGHQGIDTATLIRELAARLERLEEGTGSLPASVQEELPKIHLLHSVD